MMIASRLTPLPNPSPHKGRNRSTVAQPVCAMLQAIPSWVASVAKHCSCGRRKPPQSPLWGRSPAGEGFVREGAARMTARSLDPPDPARNPSPSSAARRRAGSSSNATRWGLPAISGRSTRREDEIFGRKCYRSVADLPAAPDASFVGVNRQLTIDIIRDLSATRRRRRHLLRLRFSRGGQRACRWQRPAGRAGRSRRRHADRRAELLRLHQRARRRPALARPARHAARRPGRRRPDPILEHRLQHLHADARPAARLYHDGRKPGANRSF